MIEQVLSYLRSDNRRERQMGLRLVGSERVMEAYDVTVAALHDPDEDTRALAAWALDMLSNPISVPLLVEALYDPVFEVRSNAGWALVHLAHRTTPQFVIPEIVDVLCDQHCRDARQMAYLVLHHIGGDLARSAIREHWRG